MAYFQQFSGPNLAYLLEQYERFQQDPASVRADLRELFASQGPPPVETPQPLETSQRGVSNGVATANLAHAIRSHGYLAARLDPLGSQPPGDPNLELDRHQLTEADLARLPASLVSGPAAEGAASAWEAIRQLRDIYTTRLGYDYGHVRAPDERRWLRQAAESGRFRPPARPEDQVHLLERLTQVEVFEQFLHRIYPGKTRFSIEGLDMLVPMLDEIVGQAAEANICLILLGMAHRGRLNVMAHVLGKPYEQILAEFRDPKSNFPTWDDLGWTGDVKYHRGSELAVEENDTIELLINMPPNPSHLEHINPVLEGMARGAGTRADKPGLPEFFPKAALPVLIHGDASFIGEGIVAETLNLHALPGYHTGGSLHIIANNQLGFTTTRRELSSSQFVSDLAKGFEIPILHVNADDPLACLEAARTALAYRLAFRKDFLIDLIGYRRYGHNEGDEPAFTQPVLYRQIESHSSVRRQWADRLVGQGEIPETRPDELVNEGMQVLQSAHEVLKAEKALVEPYPQPPPPGAARQVPTALPLDELQALNQALLDLPQDFNLNHKLARAMQRRRTIFEDPQAPGIDWAAAEELALASILAEGTPIRLTGEDTARGTFSQRHAIFYDTQHEGRTHIPLQALPQAKAAFEIHNSPLTENATLGFEFGFNIQSPSWLVIWEAQYGDFINPAQVILDEFLVSGRAKWGQTPSLVLLLPHGNEGQGPDHSSGRPERFLQMAANHNLRLANPTTAAQYFHLLRRQAALLASDPLPLIVFTPKGLLRHPQAASSPSQLAEGIWQPLLVDLPPGAGPQDIRRLALCSGRVAIDLLTSEAWQQPEEKAAGRMAIVRLEQVYPFRSEILTEILERFPNLEEIDFVQEEPQNMGVWEFLRPRLEELLAARWPLHYIGRPPASSPAEGSTTWYHATQRALIHKVFSHQAETLIDSDIVK
jgi:2-oxoglutarate dehydrogenase E1 component